MEAVTLQKLLLSSCWSMVAVQYTCGHFPFQRQISMQAVAGDFDGAGHAVDMLVVFRTHGGMVGLGIGSIGSITRFKKP